LALASGSDLWDFAVEIEQLHAAGVTNAILRWLIREGHVEHRREVTGERSRKRRFHTAGNLAFESKSCFVVTERGYLLAAVHQPDAARVGTTQDGEQACLQVVPHWDDDRRQLMYRGLLVKEFRGHPGNQERMLVVFEEEGWAPRIDDPLPPVDGIDPAARVRETIRRLNRIQRNPLLGFEADGRGGILWFPRDAHATPTDRPCFAP
jgi:hypothetical protein